MPESDTVQLGPFELRERIGAGGMGAVYRARHVETDQPVAIKALLADVAREPKHQRNFRREVQALAKLHHPAIAAILDYGTIDGKTAERGPEVFVDGAPWFAMEFVDGYSMPTRAENWQWETLESILIQVLDALAHAHARSIVHRDLKPGNMLLTASRNPDDPSLKLVDFGIARLFDRSDTVETTSDRITGTPNYMAPEQILGRRRNQGPWTDLYALGCLTWRLACDTAPFDAENTKQILKHHVESPLPDFDPAFPVPEGFEDWLGGLLCKDVDRRTRRAADAVWQLSRLGDPVQTSPPSTESPHNPIADADDRRQPTLRAMTETLPDGGAETVEESAPTPIDDPTEMESMASTIREADPPDDLDPTATAPVRDAGLPPMLPDWRRNDGGRSMVAVPKAGLQLFSLRDVPVVDREAERDRLWAALERVHHRGEPELVTLEGEAGNGKSRLAQWLCRRAHETGAAVVLRASHTANSEPDAGLREMIRRLYQTEGLSRAEVFERLAERLPSLPSNDTMRLTDTRALTELLRPTGDETDDVDGPPYQFSSADQKYALVRRWLERLATRRPVIWWVDDLQWGSASTGVVEQLFASRDDAPPVLVVGTLRSDVVADDPDIDARFSDLWANAEPDRIALSPMAPDDHRQLIDRLLHLSPDLAERLAERTEGNPLFAIQLLREWVERDRLVVGDRGFERRDDGDIHLPDDIHQLWLERLERLADDVAPGTRDELRESLELAAALGRQVDAREWHTLLEDADLAPPDGLVDTLVERGLAERIDRGWAFTHGLLVESMTHRARREGRWRDHHRRCARILESTASGDEPGRYERIADHWIEAGEPDAALAPLLDEIRLLRTLGDDSGRRRLLEQRRRLLDDLGAGDRDPRRLAQQIALAELVSETDDQTRARTLLSKVWDALDDGAVRLRAWNAATRARVEQELGQRDLAKQWAHEALEVSRRADTDRFASRAHWMLGWVHFYEAQLEEALHHAERAVAAADRADDAYGRLAGRRIEASVRKAQTDRDATPLFESIRDDAAEAGFATIEAESLNGLGEQARFEGELDAAREYYRQGLAKQHEASRPIGRGITAMNLALVEFRAGNLDRALGHFQSCRQIYESAGIAHKWKSVLHLMRLTHATATGDDATFETLWAPLDDGWPDDWQLVRDNPWLLETCGDYALEAGWPDRTEQLWQLARDLYEEFGDEQAASSIEQRLSDL